MALVMESFCSAMLFAKCLAHVSVGSPPNRNVSPEPEERLTKTMYIETG